MGVTRRQNGPPWWVALSLPAHERSDTRKVTTSLLVNANMAVTSRSSAVPARQQGLDWFCFLPTEIGSVQQKQSQSKTTDNGKSYRYKLSRSSTTSRTKQRQLSLLLPFHHSFPASKRTCDYLNQQLRPLNFDMQSADKTIAEYLRKNSEEFRTLDDLHQKVSSPYKICENRQS
jgi:hypothetical protein